jgi:hypothetical protein
MLGKLPVKKLAHVQAKGLFDREVLVQTEVKLEKNQITQLTPYL